RRRECAPPSPTGPPGADPLTATAIATTPGRPTPGFCFVPPETDSAMSRVFVYDTTLRDGSQGEGVNFSLQDKLLITRKLDELGVDFIEGGYPLSNPKDFEYFREVRQLPLRHA